MFSKIDTKKKEVKKKPVAKKAAPKAVAKPKPKSNPLAGEWWSLFKEAKSMGYPTSKEDVQKKKDLRVKMKEVTDKLKELGQWPPAKP